MELAEVLAWARSERVISAEDELLLMDLVSAAEETADQDTPWTRRGICTQAAVRRVAARRGWCTKTVMRRRDQIVEALRGRVNEYAAVA